MHECVNRQRMFFSPRPYGHIYVQASLPTPVLHSMTILRNFTIEITNAQKNGQK